MKKKPSFSLCKDHRALASNGGANAFRFIPSGLLKLLPGRECVDSFRKKFCFCSHANRRNVINVLIRPGYCLTSSLEFLDVVSFWTRYPQMLPMSYESRVERTAEGDFFNCRTKEIGHKPYEYGCKVIEIKRHCQAFQKCASDIVRWSHEIYISS